MKAITDRDLVIGDIIEDDGKRYKVTGFSIEGRHTVTEILPMDAPTLRAALPSPSLLYLIIVNAASFVSGYLFSWLIPLR